MLQKPPSTDSNSISSNSLSIHEQETRFVFDSADNPTIVDENVVAEAPSENPQRPADNQNVTTDLELTLGSVIKNTYQLVAMLGEGGMGRVFKAKNLLWEKRRKRNPYLAIKILNSELSANEAFVDSFFRDFDRTKMLSKCPNIIDVYTFEEEGEYAYITMECLEGKTLTRLIKENGVMNLAQTWFIIEGIGEALDYAHRNDIVHRDIKPANIMITETNVVKVLDFGIASKINEVGELTVINGQDLGALTTAYASPEMLRSRPFNPDARDDIYAFACVIYELLTGKKFYDQILKTAEPEITIRPGINIPEWIASNGKKSYEQVLKNAISGLNNGQMEALSKALAFERENRTESIRTLLKDLKPDARREKRLGIKLISIASGLVIFAGLVFWKIKPFTTDKVPTTAIAPLKPVPVVVKPIQKTVITPPVLVEKTPLPAASTPVKPPAVVEPKTIPAPAITPIPNPPSSLSHEAISSDNMIQIQTSKPVYKIKEHFRLSVKLRKKRYIQLVIRNAKNEENILINQLLGTQKQLFKSTVEGPAGKDTFSIIASETPFPKEIKILNEDGSISDEIKNGGYSWAQIQYTIKDNR